jgi:hypothetical protein
VYFVCFVVSQLKPRCVRFHEDEAKPERRPNTEGRSHARAFRVSGFGLLSALGFRVSGLGLCAHGLVVLSGYGRARPALQNRLPWPSGLWHQSGMVKTANQLRRAAWASARGVTEEQLKQAEAQAKELAGKRKKSKLRSQKGAVPPGAETADIEGWEPFAWKNNCLRHSFISYRLGPGFELGLG